MAPPVISSLFILSSFSGFSPSYLFFLLSSHQQAIASVGHHEQPHPKHGAERAGHMEEHWLDLCRSSSTSLSPAMSGATRAPYPCQWPRVTLHELHSLASPPAAARSSAWAPQPHRLPPAASLNLVAAVDCHELCTCTVEAPCWCMPHICELIVVAHGRAPQAWLNNNTIVIGVKRGGRGRWHVGSMKGKMVFLHIFSAGNV
jgi:hypothetical protein